MWDYGAQLFLLVYEEILAMYLSRLFFSAFALLALTQNASADLIFEVKDNGNGTTDWTLSGSGTTGSAIQLGALIQAGDWHPGGTINSTSGSWTIGARTSVTEQLASSLGADNVTVGWDAQLPKFTDLSAASGTVTFPVAFNQLVLPQVQAFHSAYGRIEINAISAIPEPSTLAAVGLGVALAVSRRRRSS